MKKRDIEYSKTFDLQELHDLQYALLLFLNHIGTDLEQNPLDEKNIKEKDIHFELFTSTEEGTLTETHDGNTSITVTVDDETKTFVMSQEKSVLEAALAEDLDAPYSCQGGICSTCIARVKEGKVEMRKNQILTDSELEEGLILTCQSHPTTPTLVVDYDDV